jgi:aminoglycoside phosphotransferase (APT) family kinase protein
MDEEKLPGGNLGGAVRVGETVRREAGPWTPAVGELLRHLERKGFEGAPRFLGIDEQGREVLGYIEGETVGDLLPWPPWTHDDETLDQVADWLAAYHAAVEDFEPPSDAVWRLSARWSADVVVGHNDAAPYNAVWRDGRLAGFIDWEFAAPVPREWDLAFVASSWVPLHARHVVEREGFTNFEARPARLRRLLARYGWDGELTGFLEVVRERVLSSAHGLRELAASGDTHASRLLAEGAADDCELAAEELSHFKL